MTDIFQQVAHDFSALRGHLPHHHQVQPAPQPAPAPTTEDRMPLLADAKTAIEDIAGHLGALAANPLIDTLAEEGLGLILTPDEVQVVKTLVKTLEDRHQAQGSSTTAPIAAAG